MKVRNKLKLLVALYASLPVLFIGMVGFRSPIMEHPDFQKAFAIGIAVVLYMIVSNHWVGMQWLLNRQLRRIERFCAGIRSGRHPMLTLPNQPADPADENELDALMREMNWMANQIKLRETQWKGAVESLESANRDLADANVRIAEARDALWGEMALARKIQTALIPSGPEIPGFDIAAELVPADEVGGDYFDVLTVRGRHWIVVGDVSGHGVPAGLVMMMAQTAVHTALRLDPTLDPARLLAAVNRALTGNIRRLGESRYMTLTVLEIREDGRFRFAGLHQDILIYRAAERTVEEIETRGIWIGILDEISEMAPMDRFRLEPGDALLLFTDGVTEARDAKGGMFGNRRLANLLREHGDRPAPDILRAAQSALGVYRKDDDTTLLVCKFEPETREATISPQRAESVEEARG
jgi:serine phosphatase RsbU (regulator of sigma subunit)